MKIERSVWSMTLEAGSCPLYLCENLPLEFIENYTVSSAWRVILSLTGNELSASLSCVKITHIAFFGNEKYGVLVHLFPSCLLHLISTDCVDVQGRNRAEGDVL